MALETEEVEKIAHLARLNLGQDEQESIKSDLNNILALVDHMNQVDCDNEQPMAHPLNATQVLREDAVTETNQRESYQAIAPKTEAGLYLVPKVIE